MPNHDRSVEQDWSWIESPDQFLYARTGPWPQPSPTYPMLCADEVLHVPALEELQFNQTIGARYLEARIGYPPMAAKNAIEHLQWTGPDDKRFNEILFSTVFTRFLVELNDEEKRFLAADEGLEGDGNEIKLWKYDFTAMDLIKPIDGTYCAATKLYIREDEKKNRECIRIVITSKGQDVVVRPGQGSWGIAKIYALQGASYHALFVVHPELHFPMDSVNAITKSAVPIAHPLFQLLHPHSSYSLALDNAVLESAESVVSSDAQGTRFDPLTANAYNLKLLFGAGYDGLPEPYDPKAYPEFDYMKPQKGFDSDYGRWLEAYYGAFRPFCEQVAKYILENRDPDKRSRMTEFVKRWANYNHAHVLGFPDAKDIVDPQCLAETTAIYIWNASVAHGGDHASFAGQVTPVEKCLRIRRPPPTRSDENPVTPGEIFNPDDLARAELAQYMFFQPWAIEPNLDETYYAFTDPNLWAATNDFHGALREVSKRSDLHQFMPLKAVKDTEQYFWTIPQSIQY